MPRPPERAVDTGLASAATLVSPVTGSSYCVLSSPNYLHGSCRRDPGGTQTHERASPLLLSSANSAAAPPCLLPRVSSTPCPLGTFSGRQPSGGGMLRPPERSFDTGPASVATLVSTATGNSYCVLSSPNYLHGSCRRDPGGTQAHERASPLLLSSADSAAAPACLLLRVSPTPCPLVIRGTAG